MKLKFLVAIIVMFFTTISCGFKSQKKTDIVSKTTKKQNILFIAVDDLRPLLSTYENKQMITPNLDRLASQSVQFNNAYCNIAVCGASRASIMTGIRPNQNRFSTYYTSADQDLPGATSLQGVFKQNGYTTVSYGKILHNASDFEKDWTEVDNTHDQFDYQNPASIENAKNTAKGRERGPAFEVAEVSDDTYSDGKTTNKAIEKLKGFQKSGEPFFLAVGYVSPHLPFIQPKKYWDLYDDDDLKIADNPFQPKNSPSQAMHNSPELRSMYTGIPKEGEFPISLTKDLIHGYYASVSYTDALIGKMISTLDALGLRENTTIILWGDHGFFLGEHGMWTKHSTLKEAIQIPLLVSSPGMKKNARTNAMTEYVDIYPSLCEIAGIKAPSYLDGLSFVPVLKDPKTKVKSEIYTRHGIGEAVVDANYSYTEFVDKNGNPISNMLFNMNTDEGQNTDISGEPETKALVEKYSQKLKTMRTHVNKKPF